MFEGLAGQEYVKRTLSESLASGRAGHAYLFCGPDGIGRKSFALEFARAAACNSPGNNGEACGQCVSCRLAASSTNPDIMLVRGDEKKASVGVETVRGLEEDIATAPTVSEKKIFIIDRSEKLTVQAQNALLKTIEEPPEYVMLILICANPSLLLDTVRSRVTRIDFARNSREEVLRAYRGKAGAPASADEEDLIAAYADGIIGRGLAFTDFGVLGGVREKIMDTVCLLKEGESAFYNGFMSLFTDAAAAEHREFMFFELASLLHDISLFSRFSDETSLQNKHFRNKITELAAIAPHTAWAEAEEKVSGAWRMIGQNVNFRMAASSMAAGIAEAVRSGR